MKHLIGKIVTECLKDQYVRVLLAGKIGCHAVDAPWKSWNIINMSPYPVNFAIEP